MIDLSQQKTIAEFAKDFYKPTGLYCKHLQSRAKQRSTGYWLQQQSRLERYILPQFGHFKPALITQEMINTWLEGLALSGSTKNKILYSLKSILAEAKRRAYIDYNPCLDIEAFAHKPKESKPFSLRELTLFFPEKRDELLAIWQTPMWAAYFLCLADCGHRPGEQSVLLWKDLWHSKGKSGFIINKAMDGITKQPKPCTKTGYSRATLVSKRALKALQLWHSVSPFPQSTDFIFTLDGLRGVIPDSVNKHLRLSAPRAGVKLSGRTPYCFRHTFNTLGLLQYPASQLRFLMGHRTEKETYHYYHPNRQLLIQQATQTS